MALTREQYARNNTGRVPAYRLTQEYQTYASRVSHAPFTYLAAFAFAFIAAGVVLALMSPEHDWVFSVATAAMWGTVVALQSRGAAMPISQYPRDSFNRKEHDTLDFP